MFCLPDLQAPCLFFKAGPAQRKKLGTGRTQWHGIVNNACPFALELGIWRLMPPFDATPSPDGTVIDNTNQGVALCFKSLLSSIFGRKERPP